MLAFQHIIDFTADPKGPVFFIMKKFNSKQILTTVSKIIGLAFTLTKIIDLWQGIKARATTPSPEEINKSRLDYERQLAKIKEDHLRNKLEIKRDYAQQKEIEHVKQGTTGPFPPKAFNLSTYGKRWEDLRLFASVIHSGDRGVIIAPKGVGKSALAMCIGAACASGAPTGLWPTYDEGHHSPQRVLYYDCELTDTDMYNRYGRYGFEFPQNFERYDYTQFKDAYQILADLQWKVEHQMAEGDEATVFIDNITKALKTEQVSEINRFNDTLDEIYKLSQRRGIKLTLITIVHVLTGEYKPGTPITLKEAAGGSNLTNFANFVLAIEQPKTKGNIILVKVLNSRGEPEPDNVCVLRRVGKDEGTHYHFEYVGEMPEKEALQGELTSEDDSEAEQTKEEQYLEEARAIRAWLDEDSHRTQDDAAKHFGYKSRITICNRLKLLKNNGEM